MATEFSEEGGCSCGHVRYRLLERPMFVHCCHCSWCQRESGAAFALNALIEAGRVEALEGELAAVDTPSQSGKGQRVFRCARCQVALYSHYGAAGDAVRFVRVGTLDHPSLFPPDIHIFTSSKQAWLQLSGGAPAVAEYYRRSEHWPEASIARYRRAVGR